MRRVAKVELTTSLLCELLHFPTRTRIVAANGERAYEGTIELIVESPDLQPVEEGEQIPTVSPVVTNSTFDWGQSKADGQ